MIERTPYLKVWRELAAGKSMIFLAGPRQTGKTTLANAIAASCCWGVATDGRRMEINGVAESTDRKTILVGEVKWTSDAVDAHALTAALMDRARRLPGLDGRKLVGALWLRTRPRGSTPACVVCPDDVLEVLR